jgi:hypothetical protein
MQRLYTPKHSPVYQYKSCYGGGIFDFFMANVAEKFI